MEKRRSCAEDITEIMDSSTRVLPSDMLCEIFAYLPLRDRKSVRLVSRLWRDCSILQSTTEHEKFVFRNGHLVKDIAEAMLQSNYTRLNLEFQDLPVNSLQIRRMLRLCGDRIVTIKFFQCKLNDSSLGDIIVHCENLTSIVIEATLPESGVSLCKIQWPSPTIFTDLVEQRIRRPKLSTFSMLIDNDVIPAYDSSEILLLFPCIKHLGIGTVSEKEKFTYSRSLFLGYTHDNQLDPRDFVAFTRLESFTFNLPTIGRWMGTLHDEAEQGHGLKYLETMLIYDGSMKNTVLKFFKSQRNLEVLRLGLGTPSWDEMKEFFFQILECCPNLQELRLKTEPHYLLLEPSEVPRFVASISKLKVLSLSFVVSDSITYHDSPADPVLSNLKSLYWDSSSFNVNHDFSHAFLRRCSSLQHLKLAVCCDTTLQIIFENMLELQTLVLTDLDNGTTSGFCGQPEGYSIRRLQKLKKLELHDCYDLHFSEENAFELQLPRLEVLLLNASFYEDLSDEALCRLASRLPELKVLAVEDVHVDYHRQVKTVQLCKQLKNLYRLTLVEGYDDHTYMHDTLMEENLEDLFNACPHLSYFAGLGGAIYWRNPSSKKVFRKDLASFKFAGNYVEGSSVTRPYIHDFINMSNDLYNFIQSVLV